ncbi:hypothetical protein R1sor_006152 [Riccia sorocarpa]|uniref:C-terminal of Roc (COR) domain-containing protein n=1 Tax=Riccia sorocarpa TaxID=122646 RepID=A0ABD3HQU1_9MARC
MATESNYRVASWLESAAEHRSSSGSNREIPFSDGIKTNERFFDISGNISEPLLQQNLLPEQKELLQAIDTLYLDNRFNVLNTFDDDQVELRMPSEEWVSFFTSLLPCLPSLRRILITCSTDSATLYNAICIAVGQLLSTSSTLESLEFWWPPPLSDQAVRTLSQGLVETKRLKSLHIEDGRFLAPVLVNSLTGDPHNTSLETLVFKGQLAEIGLHLPVLLSRSSQNLKTISMPLTFGGVRQHTIDAIQEIVKCLQSGQRLQYPVDTNRELNLQICFRLASQYKVKDVHTAGNRLFTCLNLWMEAGKYVPVLMTCTLWVMETFKATPITNTREWLLRTLSEYRNLGGLRLKISWDDACMAQNLDMARFVAICEGIQSSRFLESLEICGPLSNNLDRPLDHEFWIHLFQCLRDKQRSKKLRLQLNDRTAGDDCFRSLMNLLQRNIYLEEVGVPVAWRSEGKGALVMEALRRNKAQASYFRILQNAGVLFGEARVGRIFLCGQPYAGKTRLHASMIGTGQKKNRIMKQLRKHANLKRTKGMDVELLRDDGKMQITIWDFAGQEIFRALQSLLLPVITQACVFVVAFSPMEDDQRQLKHNLVEAFENELDSWLRFISSSYPISGTFLPEVLVVISHRDLMEKHKLEGFCDWSLQKVKHFRKVYQGALNLHEDLYYMNTQDEKAVQPFVEDIFLLFSHMFETRTPQAPTVCFKLSSEILNLRKEKDNQPVWQIGEFYTFLSNRLKSQAEECFNPNTENERKVLKAISLYLHDVGSIFLLPDSDLVVIDINWLTHRFLGRLISEGHGFEVKRKILQESSRPEGFVSKFVLDNILSSVSSKSSGQDITTLFTVLVSLGLCYEVECSTGVNFFIPTVVERQTPSQESLSWETGESSNWQHVGYRLLCENRNTASLTSSVFPRFQIRFRKELMKQDVIEINDRTYVCQRDLIKLDWNGYFIIIEYDGVAGDHVDILVRFSKSKLPHAAVSFVKEQILEKFRLFCASPEGCRGVTLATAIIRPDCVKRLTPRRYRADQVILEGSLKKKLKEAVMQKSYQGESTWSTADESEESLLDYEHMWPQELTVGLPKCSQRAVELLEDKDVQEILEPIQQSKSIRLQSLYGVRKQVDDYFNKDRKEARKEDADAVDMGGLRINDESIILTDEQRRLEEMIKEEGTRTRSQLQMAVKGLHQHLEEVHRSLSQQLHGIFTLQKEIRSTLLALVTKMDDMMGYSAAMADARLPRRPFITVSDVGVRGKVKGILKLGTPVRLHFMCESYLEPHVVDGQAGLELIIGDKNKEFLRRIIGISLRVFWFLLKAGLQIGLAAGNALPELADAALEFTGDLVLDTIPLEKLKELESLPVMRQTEMTEEVWMYLKDQLSNISLAQSFKLHLVKYNPGIVEVGKSYAWLCEKCIAKGKNALKLA